jgi:hypothetical protein
LWGEIKGGWHGLQGGATDEAQSDGFLWVHSEGFCSIRKNGGDFSFGKKE